MRTIGKILCVGILFNAGRSAAGDYSGSSWYRGDLHVHSNYSDGDSSPREVFQNALDLGLDFLALTDHDNKQGGDLRHWLDEDSKSVPITKIFGVEWTTPLGHANVFAPTSYDYRQLWQDNLTANPVSLTKHVGEVGGLLSINHPAPGRKHAWKLGYDFPFNSMEIWNSNFKFFIPNSKSVYLVWDTLLRAGRRIVGIGGSDTHFLKVPLKRIINHGLPTTWIFSSDSSSRNLLQALGQGHVSISYKPTAPRLELLADVNGEGKFEAMMGDKIKVPTGGISLCMRGVHHGNRQLGDACPEIGHAEPVDLTQMLEIFSAAAGSQGLNAKTDETLAQWRKKYLVVLRRDGQVFRSWFVDGPNFSVRTENLVSEGIRYYRLELVGNTDFSRVRQVFLTGDMLGMTNPIYIDNPN